MIESTVFETVCSRFEPWVLNHIADVVELVDARDLKSLGDNPCQFKSDYLHHYALLAQQAEAPVSKAVKSEFESQGEYQCFGTQAA